ncbi:MAG TPA: multiheme c-type cytochrome, partial [Polyangia bacterium]|nr:multiheme c-type cytochrome [Polyangia bacterium]
RVAGAGSTALGFALVSVLGFAAAGCGNNAPATRFFTQAELRDPAACQACHPDHVREWSGSMHAYASDDPVFRAMNKRAQRETSGALADFCVKCHAPMAVRDGLTTDGLNLDQLPATAKGVTCYFCHSAQAIDGTHNNPLQLATDGSMFASISDPVASAPHKSSYGTLHDPTHVDSASACGSCHDIVNTLGAPVERTFQEWQASIYAVPPMGLTCSQSCHVDERQAPVANTTTKVRTFHSHTFVGVDLALTDFPEKDAQRTRVQSLLDIALQSSICLDPVRKQIEIGIDNAAAGHGFPSGATPDRRAWVDVTAYQGDTVVYQSGQVGADQTVETLADPDLWLIRDCIYDTGKQETPFFWQAASLLSNQIPASVTTNVADPASFTKSHLKKLYPADGTKGLDQVPDRITLKVHLKAIGDDILAGLVASGDLDPSLPPLVPTFDLAGGAQEWTQATSTPMMGSDGILRYCKLPITPRFVPTQNVAVSHARCPPPM